MNNATTSDYLVQCGVGMHGLVIVIANSLLFLTIRFDKSLRKRKEMIIIAGRAGADFIYGLATFLSAIYRVPLMIQGVHTDPYTALQCMIIPSVPLIYIGLLLTTFMNFVISTERYIAVAHATTYRSLGVDYAKKVLLVVFILFLVFLVSMFASILLFPDQIPYISRMCLSSPFPKWYTLIYLTAIPFIGFLSVFVYIGVFVAYRSFLKQVQPASQKAEQQNAAQRRLTETLGIIMISTLFFFIIPYAIIDASNWFNSPLTSNQTLFLTSMVRMNTLVSIVIYVLRQQEIRHGMWNLLKCGKGAMHTLIESNPSPAGPHINVGRGAAVMNAFQ